MSYNQTFQFDASTFGLSTPPVQVLYPTPGANVAAYGQVTGSWVSPNFNLEWVNDVNVVIASSGSIIGNSGSISFLSGTVAVQATVEPGNGNYNLPVVAGGFDFLNAQLVTTVTGSPGGFVNWYTLGTLNINSASLAQSNFTNVCARALRLVFTAGNGAMSGTMGVSMAMYGVKSGH